MGPIKTRVFSRLVGTSDILPGLAAVEGEVNDFLETLDPNNVADVRYATAAVGKYGEWTLHTGTVLYMET